MSRKKEPSATFKAIVRNAESANAARVLSQLPQSAGTLKRIPVGTSTLGTKAVVEVYEEKGALYVRAIANTTEGPMPYAIDNHGPYTKPRRALRRAMAVAELIVTSGFPHPRYWICR